MISKRTFAAMGVALGLAAAALPAASAEYAALPGTTGDQRVAVFAGGCFWCIEADFDKIPGVLATTSGYTGGTTERPSYRDVVSETTGHYEALHVVYDPDTVSYDQLLTAFWHSVDPTDGGGQFCDRGDSYRTAIFPLNAEQRSRAEASKAAIEASGVLSQPIATRIVDADAFYPAERYHQDYYKNNGIRYTIYRNNCGRDRTVKRVWGDMAYTGIPKG